MDRITDGFTTGIFNSRICLMMQAKLDRMEGESYNRCSHLTISHYDLVFKWIEKKRERKWNDGSKKRSVEKGRHTLSNFTRESLLRRG